LTSSESKQILPDRFLSWWIIVETESIVAPEKVSQLLSVLAVAVQQADRVSAESACRAG
jgi:hypothetical protein